MKLIDITDRNILSKATAKGHKHFHRPTWQPVTREALTHAWYRRHGKNIPSRMRRRNGRYPNGRLTWK